MTTQQEERFEKWFQDATGNPPFSSHAGFACESTWPKRIDGPTGLGKTAMAVQGWVWRRRFHPDGAIQKATFRRLVYCLPMRARREAAQREAEKKRAVETIGGKGATP